jgi:hypothetical protein
MTRLRLRWWELVPLALPVLISTLFLVGEAVVAGVVLLALVVLVVASRADIVERNVAGGYARVRGQLELAKVAALLAIYSVILGLFIVIQRDDWTSDTPGTVAMWSLAGLAFFLLRELNRAGDSALNWLIGSRFEKDVARSLDTLRDKGWLVSHDLKKDFGGNIDHFVAGPLGAYVIETKSGKGRAADRGQAVSNAVWAKEKFGQRWVTGVLCVGTEPPDEPERYGHVWVVGARDLVPFLARGTGGRVT